MFVDAVAGCCRSHAVAVCVDAVDVVAEAMLSLCVLTLLLAVAGAMLSLCVLTLLLAVAGAMLSLCVLTLLLAVAGAMLSLCVLTLLLAGAGAQSIENEPDWGFQSYLDADYTLKCNHSQLVVQPYNFVR